MSPRNTPPLIDRNQDLPPLWEEVSRAPVLALDLEMDSYYSYREKVCLIQLSTATTDFLIDPLVDLDLSPLARVLANPEQVKVLHAGENDIPYLRGPLGFESLDGVFDTYLAARVLNYPRCGLAALLAEHFQVELDKEMQTADWRLRPLPSAQDAYARMDTRYLLPLREILARELRERDLWEQAAGEFRRIQSRVYTPRQFDPQGWLKLRGARELSGMGASILNELYRWRDEVASRTDQAPFRVASDRSLMEVAMLAPASRGQLQENLRRQDLLEPFWACVQEARRKGSYLPVQPPRKGVDERMTPEERQRYDRLREWRNLRAAEDATAPDQVVPNRLLRQLARNNPSKVEDLPGSGLEEWRVKAYGAVLLDALQAQPE